MEEREKEREPFLSPPIYSDHILHQHDVQFFMIGVVIGMDAFRLRRHAQSGGVVHGI